MCISTRRLTTTSKLAIGEVERVRVADQESDASRVVPSARWRATASISSDASTAVTLRAAAGQEQRRPAGAGADVEDRRDS